MVEGERIGDKFWLSSELPNEVKDACRDTLLKNEALIPGWVNEVRIYWDAPGDRIDGGEASASAYMTASYCYRYANITICPPFLSEEKADRENRLRHELSHIVSYPLMSYVKQVVETLSSEDDAVTQIVRMELSEKVESMTEDLTNIITNIEKKFSVLNSKK